MRFALWSMEAIWVKTLKVRAFVSTLSLLAVWLRTLRGLKLKCLKAIMSVRTAFRLAPLLSGRDPFSSPTFLTRHVTPVRRL